MTSKGNAGVDDPWQAPAGPGDDDKMPFDLRTSVAESDLYDRVFATRPASYMSFGVSSVSRKAAIAGVNTMVLSDAVKERLDFCRADHVFKPLISSGDVSIVTLDIGAVSEWGNPVGLSDLERWPNYISAPWQECSRRQLDPEVVHIQGRFRVASAFSVGIAWPAHSTRQPTRHPLMLFHDLSEERPHYAAIMEYIDVVRRADTLVLARWKQPIPRSRVLSSFLSFQFDPR